jgi:hypothetical protein
VEDDSMHLDDSIVSGKMMKPKQFSTPFVIQGQGTNVRKIVNFDEDEGENASVVELEWINCFVVCS